MLKMRSEMLKTRKKKAKQVLEKGKPYFELTKPASWVDQRHRCWLGRFWVQFLGRYRSLA